MNKFLQTILISTIFFFTNQAFAQLTGTKTIGGTNPDYELFADAVSALNAQGVGAGGVNFIFRNGVYTGGVNITAIGTQANPIVFRSQSNNVADVTISVGGTAASVISISGASYIKFEHLKIHYTYTSTTQTKQVITLNNDNSNISFENCILERASSSSLATGSSVVYQSGSNTTNLVLKNNSIIGGSRGIYLSMSTSVATQGLIIEKNTFTNVNRGNAIDINNLGAAIIKGNTFRVQTSGLGGEAISLTNVQGKSEISNNYIYTVNNDRLRIGIVLINSSSIQGNNALIFNNSIQVFNGTVQAIGIDQSADSKFWSILHNTVLVAGGESELSRPYRNSSDNNSTEIRNNVFGNFTTSTTDIANQAIEIVHTSGVGAISNNCYFTSSTPNGGPFRGTYGTLYNEFASFIQATGETNSLNINPFIDFITNLGWKADNSFLSGAAQYIASIPTDIDGNTRTNPSTIGAHELQAGCLNATITAQPTAQTACPNATATYNVTAIGADLTYQWQFSTNNGQTWNNVTGANYTGCTTASLVVNTLEAMNGHRFRVVVQASCGSPATSQAVTLTLSTSINVTFNGSLNICEGGSITLTAASGFASYVWSNGQTTAAITVSQAGEYSVTAVSEQGCTVTSQVFTVTVQSGQTGNISVTPSGTAFYCQGSSVTLSAEGGFSNYQWSHGPTTASVNINQAGTYTVSATSPGGCSITSSPVVVTQGSIPVASFTSTQGSNNYVLSFSSSAEGVTAYTWIFPGNVTSNLVNPSHNFASDGTFPVTLIVSNPCGTDTLTQNVVVIKTSINELSSTISELSLFPNPADELITLKGKSTKYQSYQLSVVNILGQTVWNENIYIGAEWQKTIAIDQLATGTYSIILSNSEGIATQKFIKR